MVKGKLLEYIGVVKDGTDPIPEERKKNLRRISEYISSKKKAQDVINLVFICTHNSRRSIMAQLWAQLFAYYYKILDVNCFSGGTETTAFNEKAVETLQEAGFDINIKTHADNPVFDVTFSEEIDAITEYSKLFSDVSIPKDDFAAIMTCSSADEACPYVPGAESRISIPYEDPKKADDTPFQEEKYRGVSRQICLEMMFVFSLIESEK